MRLTKAMNNLYKLKKKLVPIIVENTLVFIGLILFLPLLVEKYIQYFRGEKFISSRSMRNDMYGFLGIPFYIYYGVPILKRFIGVLFDMKQNKLETVIVKSSRKNKKDALLQALFFREHFSETDFYYWKCKLNEFSKIKFAIPDTIKGPKGYSDGNYYLVTYYKYSRLVAEVKGPLDPKRIKLISKRYQFEEPPLKSD